MTRASAVRPVREAALVGLLAALLSGVVLWLGPPGTDLPAHLYQLRLYVEHGLVPWNNFWYAGRYSFVTYSLLYYPLAALLGIKLLALVSVALAAFAFALVVIREWGLRARASAWSFGILWPGTLLSATFPFTLGVAFTLFALAALQHRRRWWFVALSLSALATSPLAFALLALVLAGIGLGRWRERPAAALPAAVVVAGAGVELLVFRLFPGGGRYPFHVGVLLAVLTFAACGVLATRGLDRTGVLVGFFVVYGIVSVAVFLVPGELGGNVARVQYVAVPVALLVLALRSWRPVWLVVALVGLAGVWNIGALAANLERSTLDEARTPEYWASTTTFLRHHLTRDYRVEAVDTVGHWPAAYLPEAGVPLVRGWYRQDDFPVNRILYRKFGPRAYRAWLRELAVRYVVLTDAHPDYSSEDEAELLRSGRAGLPVVFRSPNVTVFGVPDPRPLVTGPFPGRVLGLGPTHAFVSLGGPGTYRIATRFSPYWHASRGCLAKGGDGMLELRVRRAGRVALRLELSVGRGIEVLAGTVDPSSCSG
jgi:hypothetical protein